MKILTTLILFLSFTSLIAQEKVKIDSSEIVYFTQNTLNGTKYGVIRKWNNDTIIPPIYDKFHQYYYSYFTVENNRKMGIIDTNNKIIIPIKYDYVTDLMEERLFVSDGKKMALADKNNKLITGYLYDEAWDFNEGVAKVGIGNKYGYIDKSGIVVVPIKHPKPDCTNKVRNFCQAGKILMYVNSFESIGIYQVTQANKVRTVNAGLEGCLPILYSKSGQILYKGESDEDVYTFNEGTAILVEKYGCSSSGKTGKLFDKNLKQLSSYDNCWFYDLKDNWMLVRTNTYPVKYGITDYNGKAILNPVFSEITDYTFNNNSLAKVFFEDRTFFYVDVNGKCTEYDNAKCPK